MAYARYIAMHNNTILYTASRQHRTVAEFTNSAWSPMDSPHKGQRRRVLMFSLMNAWINDWAYSPDTGDLRRHCIHCDVTVMINLWWHIIPHPQWWTIMSFWNILYKKWRDIESAAPFNYNSLGMDKWFHPILYVGCNYLSMSDLQFVKGGPKTY